MRKTRDTTKQRNISGRKTAMHPTNKLVTTPRLPMARSTAWPPHPFVKQAFSALTYSLSLSFMKKSKTMVLTQTSARILERSQILSTPCCIITVQWSHQPQRQRCKQHRAHKRKLHTHQTSPHGSRQRRLFNIVTCHHPTQLSPRIPHASKHGKENVEEHVEP